MTKNVPGKPKPVYVVLVGLNYDGKRAEPGDLVDDLPPRAVEWLLRDKCISQVEE